MSEVLAPRWGRRAPDHHLGRLGSALGRAVWSGQPAEQQLTPLESALEQAGLKPSEAIPLLAPLLVTMVGGMGLLAAILRREQ